MTEFQSRGISADLRSRLTDTLWNKVRRNGKIYTYDGVVTGCAMALLKRKLQWGYVDSRLNTSLYYAISIHKVNCISTGRNMATEERFLFPSTQLQ